MDDQMDIPESQSPVPAESQPAAAPQTPADVVPELSAPVTPQLPAAEPKRSRRSSAGKKGRGRVWVIVAVVLGLAAVGAGGWYGYRLSAERSAAQQKLSDATRLVESADKVVIEVDEVVRAEVTAEVGAKAAAAKPKVATATSDLEAALTMIDEAKPGLNEADAAHADALAASAEARVRMLEQAAPILDANAAAGEAIGPSETGWTAMLEGEKLADDAVKEYNKLTKDAVSKSASMTVQAEAKFKTAREEFDAAHQAFPAAGLDIYVQYVDLKLAAMAFSKQANAAFLAGDNAKANGYSNQYNTKDKEVVEFAKKLPESPSAAIAAAYESQAGAATTKYFQAREEATKADDELRALTE